MHHGPVYCMYMCCQPDPNAGHTMVGNYLPWSYTLQSGRGIASPQYCSDRRLYVIIVLITPQYRLPWKIIGDYPFRSSRFEIDLYPSNHEYNTPIHDM